jgi:hypothetical protein
MRGTVESRNLLGGDLGRSALTACLVVAALLMAPIVLASIGFGAILGVAGGVGSPSAASNVRQIAGTGTLLSSTSPQPQSMASGPTQADASSARGLLAGWADRGPFNQYARSNYRSDETWVMWRHADCSAAALAWMLGAYGHQLDSLDDAIALLAPGSGISPSLGLLDARGPALARGLAAHGLRPRTPGQRPLSSILELQVWLEQGPLLMDGARWFGEGHWFVGIGHDASGIYIRDTSGWDIRYLTWARLYGEVGFSGWVVGVST